jgi:hypothetical protein
MRALLSRLIDSLSSSLALGGEKLSGGVILREEGSADDDGRKRGEPYHARARSADTRGTGASRRRWEQ